MRPVGCFSGAEYEVFLRWMQQRAAARVGIVSYSAEKLSNDRNSWIAGQLRTQLGTVRRHRLRIDIERLPLRCGKNDPQQGRAISLSGQQ